MDLGAVYVSVSDLDRAAAFYSGLFDREPALETATSIGFQLDAALFLLVDEDEMGESIEFGNNCVPNFVVDDVGAAYERVRTLSPPKMDEEIRRNGPYELFQFTDPDGNVLECYAEAA